MITKKSPAKACLIIILPILLIIIFVFLCFLYFGPKVSPNKNEFLKDWRDYETISELCYKDFVNYDAEELMYMISEEENRYSIHCITKGYDHYIELNDNDMIKLCNVIGSYNLDDQCLESICVNDEFISYGNINGRSSYIYSINDNKPNFINSIYSSEKHIYIYKLRKKWYFACERN